jgi:hypothetical protein
MLSLNNTVESYVAICHELLVVSYLFKIRLFFPKRGREGVCSFGLVQLFNSVPDIELCINKLQGTFLDLKKAIQRRSEYTF